MGNLYEGGQADARQGDGERPVGTFRKRYRQLSVEDIGHHDLVKDLAENLLVAINAAYGALTVPVPDGIAGSGLSSEQQRCRALAKTKLEESIMWAIRGLTA